MRGFTSLMVWQSPNAANSTVTLILAIKYIHQRLTSTPSLNALQFVLTRHPPPKLKQTFHLMASWLTLFTGLWTLMWSSGAYGVCSLGPNRSASGLSLGRGTMWKLAAKVFGAQGGVCWWLQTWMSTRVHIVQIYIYIYVYIYTYIHYIYLYIFPLYGNRTSLTQQHLMARIQRYIQVASCQRLRGSPVGVSRLER